MLGSVLKLMAVTAELIDSLPPPVYSNAYFAYTDMNPSHF